MHGGVSFAQIPAMLAKTLAALILGLPLAIIIIGIAALSWPGNLARTSLPWLLLTFPAWIAVLCLGFAAPDGKRAWARLGGATALGAVVLVLIKWVVFFPGANG